MKILLTGANGANGANGYIGLRLLPELLGQRHAIVRNRRRFPADDFADAGGHLQLMTSTNYQVARALVDSLINETVCGKSDIRDLIPSARPPGHRDRADLAPRRSQRLAGHELGVAAARMARKLVTPWQKP